MVMNAKIVHGCRLWLSKIVTQHRKANGQIILMDSGFIFGIQIQCQACMPRTSEVGLPESDPTFSNLS
jgi:hypothetical protein